MNDKLCCIVCKAEFCFDEEEKALYEKMGFFMPPKRCKVCRGTERALNSAIRPEKEMHLAKCDQCGKDTFLPFKPKGDKPVYCAGCFSERKKSINKGIFSEE